MRCTILATLLFLQTPLATIAPPVKHKSVYDYSLVGLDGKEVALSNYRGKVMLIVTLASHSIYKDQIEALEHLQKSYADRGLAIIGIPSTDFGGLELDDNAAIKHYYLELEHVTFSVFARALLRGKTAIPLIRFLTDPKEGIPGGEIHWNYTKFLVDRLGQPVVRFEADSDPADPEFIVTLEQVLDGTFKKKESKDNNGATQPSNDDGDGE